MSEWSDQYKHPKWQKKRLEVLESAKYKCVFCNSEDNQLHVHHIVYVNSKKIWEYENKDLLVLCDECHDNLHILINSFRKTIALTMSQNEIKNPSNTLWKMMEMVFNMFMNNLWLAFCPDFGVNYYNCKDKADG